MRRAPLSLLICYCAVFIRPAVGQQYPFIAAPGAPKNATMIFQDSVGRLWLGGAQPACFDGSRFFFLRDYGLSSAVVQDVAEDPAGTIWIAGGPGACIVLQKDTLKRFTRDSQLALFR